MSPRPPANGGQTPYNLDRHPNLETHGAVGRGQGARQGRRGGRVKGAPGKGQGDGGLQVGPRGQGREERAVKIAGRALAQRLDKAGPRRQKHRRVVGAGGEGFQQCDAHPCGLGKISCQRAFDGCRRIAKSCRLCHQIGQKR